MSETTIESEVEVTGIFQATLTDRDVLVCKAALVEVLRIFEDAPAPVGMNGKVFAGRDVEILAEGFDAAKDFLNHLLVPLFIQRIESTKRIEKA